MHGYFIFFLIFATIDAALFTWWLTGTDVLPFVIVFFLASAIMLVAYIWELQAHTKSRRSITPAVREYQEAKTLTPDERAFIINTAYRVEINPASMGARYEIYGYKGEFYTVLDCLKQMTPNHMPAIRNYSGTKQEVVRKMYKQLELARHISVAQPGDVEPSRILTSRAEVWKAMLGSLIPAPYEWRIK